MAMPAPQPRPRPLRSTAARCLALALLFIATSALFLVCTWLSEHDAAMVSSIDLGTARFLRHATLVVDGLWLLVAGAALWVRRRPSANSLVLENVTVQLVSASLGLAGHFLGLATTPFALAQLGALVMGLLLFRRGPVLAGVVTCTAIAIGTAVASQVGWLPYGPLFRTIPVVDGHIAPFFHFEMMLIVVVTVLLVLGVFLFVLGRLRDREKHLEMLSKTDPLTGITNRREFFDALERELARADRRRAPLAVAILDLDHFKAVNDRHGHHAGDAVLVAAAGTLAGELRRNDVLARWGGEEFVLLLPDTDADGARVVAERCRAKLQAGPVDFEGKAIEVTASFGVAARQTGAAAASGDALVRAADEALYRAKREGRNRVEVAA